MGSAPSKEFTRSVDPTKTQSPYTEQWANDEKLLPFMEKFDDGKTGKTLSQKDIKRRHEQNMISLKADVEYLNTENSTIQNVGSNYSKQFKEAIGRVKSMTLPTQRTHFQLQLEFSEKIAHELAASGTLHNLCDLVVNCMTHVEQFYNDGEIPGNLYDLLLNTVIIVENTSDTSSESAMDICRHPRYFVFVAQKLTAWKDQHMKDIFDLNRNKLLWYFLFTIYNCSTLDQNVPRLRHLKFITLLESYLDSPLPIPRLNAFLSLGCLIKEKDSTIIEHHADILDFLAQVLMETMASSSRGTWGYSSKELAETVKKIAKKEKLKKALVQHGFLPILVKLTSSEDIEERIVAVKTLRTLSFEKEIQLYIVSHPELKIIETLTRLQHTDNNVKKRACEGALWNLREVLHKQDKYKDTVETFYEKPKVPNIDTKWHIMISYQWDNQPTVKKIRDDIRCHGYRIWMDVDNMEGSTIQAMAHAVENSEIIFLCFSDKYKNSDNCRAEAEYAFQLRKKIIPLKMEKGYKPDGWLGFIIGSKLYHNFGDNVSFETNVEGLLKELRSSLNQSDDKISVPDTSFHEGGRVPLNTSPRIMLDTNIGIDSEYIPNPHIDNHPSGKLLYSPATTVYNETVMQWSSSDVTAWLNRHNLDRVKFEKLSGKQIAFLKVQRIESPDFFYTSIVKFMKIEDLETLSNFVYALDDIPY